MGRRSIPYQLVDLQWLRNNTPIPLKANTDDPAPTGRMKSLAQSRPKSPLMFETCPKYLY